MPGVLFVITCINPACAVRQNDHGKVCWSVCPERRATSMIYSKLFYFARLRPRVLYVIGESFQTQTIFQGAGLRALQLTTHVPPKNSLL